MKLLRRGKSRFMLIEHAEERTIEGVWWRIGGLLQHFTPLECANYLRNAGYASI